VFLIDWLFPINCYGCNKPGVYFCSDCQKKVIPLKKQIYSIDNSPNCLIEKSVSLFPYSSPFDQMLKDYKYHQVRGLKEVLTDLVVKGLKKTKCLNLWRENSFVFVPVPLHPLKELKRGFNQAEELLVAISKRLDLGYRIDLIKRTKWTKTQTELSFLARQKNLAKAFKGIKNKTFSKIVIFDDVMTTGATLLSSAQALKNTGVKTVHSLTLFKKL
jgi:ComF family protein